MGTGHLLSTTTFDLPVWAVLCWLIARILRVGNDRLWLAVGLVAGPRRPFTSRWFWAGAVIAVLLWAPYLAWQAGRGWPELSVARSIANGGSGTSAPRWELLPYQLALVSPYLAAVWVAGLVGLLRGRALRWCRPLGVTYIGLAVMFLVADGKPYYLGGMFPLLLSAGAQPTMEWMRRGRARLPRGLVTAAVVLSLTAIPVHAACRASRGLASHSRRLAELRRRRDGRLAGLCARDRDGLRVAAGCGSLIDHGAGEQLRGGRRRRSPRPTSAIILASTTTSKAHQCGCARGFAHPGPRYGRAFATSADAAQRERPRPLRARRPCSGHHRWRTLARAARCLAFR
jgi:hypothetical protein